MEKALRYIGKFFMVIGFVTVFVVTAVVAGCGLGAGISMFEADLENGKSVIGIGKFSDVQVSNNTSSV